MSLSRREFLKVSGGALAGTVTGCVTVGKVPEWPAAGEDRYPAQPSPSSPADLILHNGNVLTVDPSDRVAEALAVSQGKIQKVGSDLEIAPLRGPNTRIIDLKGRTVTPGIIDAHNHMIYFGEQMKYRLDIRPPKVRDKADLLRVVKEAAQAKPEGEWIYGCQGFTMMIQDSPTRWELDEVSPKHPLYLPHAGGQHAVVNSLALKLGRVTRQTPQPYGGRIEKDEKTGEPTGRLIQYPAEDLVRRMIPKPSVEEYEAAIRHAADLFLPYGITSVQDVIVYMRQHTRIYEDMAEKQTLPVRLYILEYIDTRQKAEQMVSLHHHYHNPMCTFGGWKLAIDGGNAAGTALMYDKSQLGSKRSFPLHRPEELNQIVEILHKSGLQISIHVVGDEGMDICLDAMERACTAPADLKRRHRFEHANFPTTRNLDRMEKLGIIASVQPSWVHLYGDAFQLQMGETIARRTIPVKSFLKRGIPVAFSSDVPATMVFEPFWGFIGAVSRRTRTGKVLVPSEAVTMREALRAYTYGGAYAAFEEKEKGSLEKGKMADLAVWEQNLYTMRPDPQSLRALKVLMTILDGKIVYQDDKAGLTY